MRVGIEVGGTFTDLVAIGPDGIRVTKVPSVPLAPDEGAFNALLASGIAISSHRGACAWLYGCHQRGAGAQGLPDGVRHHQGLSRHPGSAAAWPFAHLRSRISETYAGGDASGLLRGRRAHPRRRHGRDAARCADVNPALVAGAESRRATRPSPSASSMPLSTRRTRSALRDLMTKALPDLHVTISSDITREFREFERASTTHAVGLCAAGDRPLHRTASGSGWRRRLPRPLLGHAVERWTPAGGGHARQRHQCAAIRTGRGRGRRRAPGGRSGYRRPRHARHRRHLDGRLPGDRRRAAADRRNFRSTACRSAFLSSTSYTIGAGGGSIVWVDEGGMLRVGPRSAGADPGPACYGRGGTEPTLTDAHVVRGTVRPEAFLGGRMQIDAGAAARALEPIAQRFGLSARGSRRQRRCSSPNANIVRAIQLISTERGHDPRDYVLVPYGGAGPLHAASVAEELGIATIVVPPSAGIISAYGLIASDFVLFESMTRKMSLDEAAAEALREIFGEMRGARSSGQSPSGAAGRLVFTLTRRDALRRPGLRGAGAVRGAELRALDAARRAPEVRRRASAHLLLRRGRRPSRSRFVSFRLGVAAAARSGAAARRETKAARSAARPIRIFDGKAWLDCAPLAPSALARAERMIGPAPDRGPDLDPYVPPGWTARLDANDNTILERQ